MHPFDEQQPLKTAREIIWLIYQCYEWILKTFLCLGIVFKILRTKSEIILMTHAYLTTNFY